MRGLEGKRVILTGGASGIGRATAIRLTEEGCIVGIFDLNEAGANDTVHLCANQPGKALAYTVDIADYSDLHEMMDAATCGYPFGDYLWRQTGSISSSFTKGALSTIAPYRGSRKNT